MAGKNLILSSSKKSAAVNAARWAIPLLAAGARWLSAHPEVWEGIKEQAAKLQRTSTSKPDGVLETVEVLREQVDYLAESADDADEARKAKDRTTLKKSVEKLRSEIFAAYIEEMGEDAEKAEGRGGKK